MPFNLALTDGEPPASGINIASDEDAKKERLGLVDRWRVQVRGRLGELAGDPR